MAKSKKASRKKKDMSRWSYLVILLAVVGFALTQAGKAKPDDHEAGLHVSGMNIGDMQVVVTNPAQKEADVQYLGMRVSFNPDLHIPNWVAWELTADKASGKEPRANSFATDRWVDGCASTDDYRGSGYDRGHMAPAADMKWSPKAMEQSFLLTNICPQEHTLNAGSWKKLEEKCRVWATVDSVIYIVAGPVLTDRVDEYIGQTQVAVPQRFFKVVVAPYSNPPRGIGFIMPNGRVKGGMQECAMTIDQVEQITGHDFFSELPDDIEAAVESECRFNQWASKATR